MRSKGELIEHCYQPIITRDVFNQCQEIRRSYRKKPFAYENQEFLFRDLLACTTANRIVTADRKKKTYKNGETAEWVYLRCWNPDNPEKKLWVREEKVVVQVEDVFHRLGFKSEKKLGQAMKLSKNRNRRMRSK